MEDLKLHVGEGEHTKQGHYKVYRVRFFFFLQSTQKITNIGFCELIMFDTCGQNHKRNQRMKEESFSSSLH